MRAFVIRSGSLFLPQCFFALFPLAAGPGWTQPGTPSEPVAYVGAERPDNSCQDGRLRPAIGVENIQVLRANRAHPELADGRADTYRHAPMLAYWKGHFYLEFLSGPIHEHQPPCETLLTRSPDGRTWSRPEAVFPAFKPQGKEDYTVAHQRMGFFVSASGRLLVLSFYGLPPTPNNGTGVGRCVREVHEDGSCGPIYFIRYNSHMGWSEKNTPYPFFRDCPDAGFVEACEALLRNKLMVQQWWEEDQGEDGLFAVEASRREWKEPKAKKAAKEEKQKEGQGGEGKAEKEATAAKFEAKAFCFYHRPDGKVVGIWKNSYAALGNGDGTEWTKPVVCPTIDAGMAKQWGQRTEDGRYAMLYCPLQPDRRPLVVMTSDDGAAYDHMTYVHGELPDQRYSGKNRRIGPQYVRGIVEGNGDPPGADMWVAYSVSKEDIWIARVPTPIRHAAQSWVRDDFDDVAEGGAIPDWNVYSPLWAAFAGESQARNKYTYFASVAKKEGYEQISAIFLETAEQEKEHAKLHLKALSGIGDTAANLKAAAVGEGEEWTDMYPRMASEARAEGFAELARILEGIGKIEKEHQERDAALLKNLENGTVFQKETKVKWRCRNCGFVHEGAQAAQKCPICQHPQAYFDIVPENY